MDYYSNQISRLIEESFTSSGDWCKVRAETGISYHQYAERSGGESGKVHCGCEKQCEILCTVLYIDRSGALSDLQQSGQRSADHHGSRDTKRFGSV